MNPRELISGRVGALAGVAFVLLLFVSIAMVDVPRKATDVELLDWWSDDGNLTSALVSTYLQIGAGMCFLVFATALRGVSLRAEGGNGSLATFAFASGVLLVAVLLASDGPRGVIAMAVKVNDEALPAADFLRYFPQLGYILLGTVGGVTVGVSAAATSLLILRTRAFGRWLGILGILCAAGCIVIALVAGPFFIPALLLWVLAVSVALWRAPTPETTPAPIAHGATAAVTR